MAFIGKSSWPLMCGAALLLMAAGCQTTSEAPPPTMIDTLLPASPPPDAAALRPGLAVYYANIIANSIADVEIAGRGRPGKPLPHLNWQASDTPVMTSALATQVSAQIAGYIRFPEPGTYVIKLRSNDGVRLSIGGVKVNEDPTVHGSRFSRPTTLVIGQAGWYKLRLLYFQKEGTATLELHWQRPGSADFEIVAPEAFAHTAAD